MDKKIILSWTRVGNSPQDARNGILVNTSEESAIRFILLSSSASIHKEFWLHHFQHIMNLSSLPNAEERADFSLMLKLWRCMLAFIVSFIGSGSFQIISTMVIIEMNNCRKEKGDYPSSTLQRRKWLQ